MKYEIIQAITEISNTLEKPIKKDLLIKIFQDQFNFKLDRRIYYNDEICIRFSSAKNGYSNTFLGLQKIVNKNQIPIIACIVRENYCEFMLANLTFIKSVSHSSRNLTLRNIKGSVNLSNIERSYQGIENVPVNFQRLFQLHQDLQIVDNLARIIDANKNIQPTKSKFLPTLTDRDQIFNSVVFYKNFEKSDSFLSLKNELEEKVVTNKEEILKISITDNVNIRGNLIEQLITEGTNHHDLGDYYRKFTNIEIVIDIKSKMLDLQSAPKAYNIDKLLKSLSNGNFYFGYFFIGVDKINKIIKTKLISFLDSRLIKSTIIQHHWAGRNTRGVTQLSSGYETVLDQEYSSIIEDNIANEFLNKLISL